MDTAAWRNKLESPEAVWYFNWLYPDTGAAQPARYAAVAAAFEKEFGARDIQLFSAPGRTELGGNHTDHQQGRVLAAGVTMDMVAAASPRTDGVIRFVSRGFKTDVVDTADLSAQPEEENRSAALIRGVCARFAQLGYRYGGFDAYQISDVPKGSGLSSSAAFEVLIGTILNGMYNDCAIPAPEIAKIGQYAENVYFGKPSGLMDQMASAVGGVVAIDFADAQNPVIEQVPCRFDTAGYTLCIVNAGGSHADLTDEYAAIPGEMKQVAACFGKEVLSQVDEEEFYRALGTLRGKAPDRALLRAMHFFFDSACVLQETAALRAGDIDTYRGLMVRSGQSSLNCLQNVFPAHSPKERSVALALALSAHLLADKGGWRVHGGGFAGTIQALVPTADMAAYTAAMEAVFGAGCCHPIAVRPVGGVTLPPDFGVPA